jgi:hypothetical protein
LETVEVSVAAGLHFQGAELKDASGLFNSSLDGNARRAIDIHDRDQVNESALKDLIALQWRSISRTRASRSPSEGAASGRLASSEVPAVSSP